MKIFVKRGESADGATIGELSIDGELECYTLEDVVREVEGQPVTEWKIFGKTAIPRGTYPVSITYSQHMGKDLPLLGDVPGYSGVRIHCGNTPTDTEGCILVGLVKGENSIAKSRMAFDTLFPKIQAALAVGDDVTLTVE